jgi:hypothetical protein
LSTAVKIGESIFNSIPSITINSLTNTLGISSFRGKMVILNIYILPVDNIAPDILPAAPFTVYEGLRERILPRHLDVIDKDTRDENIQYPTSEL